VVFLGWENAKSLECAFLIARSSLIRMVTAQVEVVAPVRELSSEVRRAGNDALKDADLEAEAKFCELSEERGSR
jgi:hypothetical protein